MEHTKKMVIVPMTEYDGFKNLMSKAAPSAHFNQDIRTTSLRALEDQIQTILNDTSTPERTRIQLYQNAMQKYLQIRGQTSNLPELELEVKKEPVSGLAGPVATTSTTTASTPTSHVQTMSLSEIIEKTPNNQKKGVLKLLEHLKQDGKVVWNDIGEVSVDGVHFPQSDIVKFAQTVFSNFPNVVISTARLPGWGPFRKVVEEIQPPRVSTPTRNVNPLDVNTPPRWDASGF